ncbi:condensation domain-containing protein [Nocardia sp. NPDC051911]|uniref:condensation domain-containing protein n=1 Tax=Nocardia sp. NPDC051911 TaxID=3154648 RepID=UPI0034192BC1
MRTGPLTYGQTSVLRSLRVHGPEHQAVANLVSVWAVPIGASMAQVLDAWFRLVEAHESLRTTFDDRVQTVHPLRISTIPVVELPDDSAVSAHQAAAEYAATPLAVDRDLPWRAFVAAVDGEPVYLVTIVHHVAADNEALRLLEAQFDRLLAGESICATCQPLDLAVAQQADPPAHSVPHWTKVWATVARQDRHPDDNTERRRASLYSVPGLAAARNLSERLRVSVQSVLFGISALAIARQENREQVTFALMAANRLDDRWAGMISSLNQYAPVVVTIDESTPVDEFLRGTYLRCMNAYLNACYDIDLLEQQLAELGTPESDPTAFAKHFNFLGAVETEPAPTSPLLSGIVWRSSTQRTGPNLHVAMAVGEGVLIGVGASRRYLEGELPATVAAAIEGGLVEASDGVSESLGRLSLRPIRQI